MLELNTTILPHISLPGFLTSTGYKLDLELSYELFGRELHTAPIVLVNHALSGNSHVSGRNGWWNNLIGYGATIDLNTYTVLCFNIPGNGYDGTLVQDFKQFRPSDIAEIFISGLNKLHIKHVDILIGASLGGAIGWEMIAKKSDLAGKMIAIATDYKTTDWLRGHCRIQNYLLQSSDKPLEKAREHAMLFYRTSKSLNGRFNNAISQEGEYKSLEWLAYHGKALKERFSLSAYLLMNHLLSSIEVGKSQILLANTQMHHIAIDSDGYFPWQEMREMHESLKDSNKESFFHTICSDHGHDAFLIEYDQLNTIIKEILNTK